MIDFKDLNERKSIGFQTKTKEEYAKWQSDFKEWYVSQQFNDREKQLIKEQITKLNDAKEKYFSKTKQYQTKSKMMFSDSTDAAIGEFFKAATAYLRSLPAFPRD